MKKITVDTSVIIDFLRRKDKENSLLVSLLQQDYSLSISIITHTELFSGKGVWEKVEIFETIKKICSGLKIILLEEDLSIKAGELRAKYNTDLMDSIIAATALQLAQPLATLNKKHFEKIENMSLI